MDPLGQWLDDQDIDRWSPPSSRTASLDDTPPCSPRSSSGRSYASSDDYVPSSGPDTPLSSPAKGSTDTSCSEKSGSSKEGTSKEGSSQEGSSQSSPPSSSEQDMSPPAVAYADEAESSRRVRRRIGEPRPLSSPGCFCPQSLTMDTLSIQDSVKKIEPGGRDFIPGRICYPQDFLTNSDCYVRAKTQDWLAKLEGNHAEFIKRHGQLVKELEDLERGIREMEAHPKDWVKNGLDRVGPIPDELRQYCVTHDGRSCEVSSSGDES